MSAATPFLGSIYSGILSSFCGWGPHTLANAAFAGWGLGDFVKAAISTWKALAAQERCTMVIASTAYDFTDFMANHPGGAEYLRKNSGKVATEEFIASHPEDIIERTLTRPQLAAMTLGRIDAATITPTDIAVVGAAARKRPTSRRMR
jgi:hypothetical protein